MAIDLILSAKRATTRDAPTRNYLCKNLYAE
jgi:hypothetical protein